MLKITNPVRLYACALLILNLGMAQVSYANDGLWEALKEGGKVVLMRHAPVEKGADRGDPLLRDPTCRYERNLSEQGKEQAALLGSRFQARAIPIEKVAHSPYCRTTATAEIAFGNASPARYLSLIEVLEPEEARRQTETLNEVIGSYAGTDNLILITHEPNIRAVSFEMMKHLDFLVIEPAGEGEFEELGVIRFSASDWE